MIKINHDRNCLSCETSIHNNYYELEYYPSGTIYLRDEQYTYVFNVSDHWHMKRLLEKKYFRKICRLSNPIAQNRLIITCAILKEAGILDYASKSECIYDELVSQMYNDVYFVELYLNDLVFLDINPDTTHIHFWENQNVVYF